MSPWRHLPARGAAFTRRRGSHGAVASDEHEGGRPMNATAPRIAVDAWPHGDVAEIAPHEDEHLTAPDAAERRTLIRRVVRRRRSRAAAAPGRDRAPRTSPRPIRRRTSRARDRPAGAAPRP